ncbi:MAG: hypothetical protein EXR55_02075 [Dehalococcoidia bacterium]|nr:hypothetical protein [Dehalococcoidia bacterium]
MPLYRHILETLDSVGILVRSSAAYPSFSLLRATLESLIYVRYILEKDSSRRARAYTLAEIHGQMKLGQLGIEGPPERIALLAAKDRDVYLRDTFAMPLLENGQESVQDLEKALESPKYASIEEEVQKIKAVNKRGGPEWYRLFNGPSSIE